MLNGIGIQNPGIETWLEETAPRLRRLKVPVWGSAVGHEADGFARVAKEMMSAGIQAVEINLSCPNLDGGQMFSFSPAASAAVVEGVVSSVDVPVGAKLSPNTPDIVEVAAVCREAGADFVVLTNTAYGFGIDIESRRPLLSGGVGGYSGPGLKPVSLRCVYEVARAIPDLPIVGCGGVLSGSDVAEYLIAGASAVQMGTVHLAEPKAGARISRELKRLMSRMGIASISDLVGKVEEH
jgi:dihydroorotate dehydrogenase (NAD+) catalytic subunit